MENSEIVNNTKYLENAIKKDQLQEVKEILQKGVYINSKNCSGLTPLFVALRHSNQVELFGELLKFGASVFEKNDCNETPLHVALDERKSLNVIKEILNYKPDMNCLDQYRRGSLGVALTNDSSLEIFHELLEQGANVNQQCCHNMTPLNYAILMFKPFKIIKLFLNYGADINTYDYFGYTAVHLAIVNGYSLEIFKEFYKQGVDINRKTDNGGTLFISAVSNCPWDVIQFMLERGADIHQNDVLRGAINGNYSMRKLVILLNHGASVHKTLTNVEDETRCSMTKNIFAFVILTKYGLLEHISCQICESFYQRWCMEDFVMCKSEIDKLRATNITDELTLYDILSKKYDYGKLFSRDQDVLSNLQQLVFEYPIYSDLILLRLETRIYLLRQLNNVTFFIEANTNNVIQINSVCVREIANFLSKQELKQFKNSILPKIE